MATARARHEVEREIESTLGLVPSFLARIPDELLDYEWMLFKRFEIEYASRAASAPVIPPKYRQLIGIALHAATKCQYCGLFHTELARLFGATEEEIQEAAHYAKHSLGWSGYLNGIRADFDHFSDELQEIGDYLQRFG